MAIPQRIPASEIDGDQNWPMVERQLPPNWREIVMEFDLIPEDPPDGAKVKTIEDFEQMLRLVCHHVATNTSLRTTTATGVATNVFELSAPGLHGWMRKLGPFMERLLMGVTTNTQEVFAAERWGGYDIRLEDATTSQEPGAKGTTARIHVSLQLTTLRPTQIIVTDRDVGETFRHFDVKGGQLHIGDRVYANPPGIAWTKSHGADVLVRYNWVSLPVYDVHGKRIDLFEKFKKMRKQKPGRERDWIAYVRPAEGEPVRGRLCAVRLPADKAKEARERIIKEYRNKGKEASKKVLVAAEFVVVYTTVPRGVFTAAQVMELYRLRWQIELSFKRDKSIAGLDKLPNHREDTIHTWLCTKLLLIQIARKIAAPDVVLANILSPKLPKADRFPDAIPITRHPRWNPKNAHSRDEKHVHVAGV
jgi:IS4 transposase